MKKIGVLFGAENSFPSALVERINARNVNGISAEFVEVGAPQLDKAPPYAVILDRASHSVPFYRAYLKHAALKGTEIVNNPFWSSADDKFFNYTLAARLHVAVPPTVILPHKQLPNGTTDRTMRNLQFPLDWDGLFAYVGEHGFLKPVDGGGWRDVHHVHSREEFFRAYDQSRDLCMIYQKAIEYSQYFRCFVIGRRKVRIMAYDPRRPYEERYVKNAPPTSRSLLRRMTRDAITLCDALGYDLNTVEFAVEKGIPYAIDFMNPAPDADLYSVGQANFDWIVKEVADMLIAKAKSAARASSLRWTAFLGAGTGRANGAAKKRTARKPITARPESLSAAPAPAPAAPTEE